MSSTSKKQVRVSRVADWAGWCTPCESEDRPLVLTRTGPGGLTSWLAGLGDEDRFLLLTCNVCGHWQVVPACEEDDPEVVLTEDALSDDEAVREDVHQVLAEARAVVLPAPRAELDVLPAVPVVADLPAAPLVADLPASPVSIAEPAVLDLGDVFLEVPPGPARACAVPAPRRAPE
ncbi:MAG: hypothetical protein JWM62_2582, partial [Frankiales bacterium]|nr:hypothetical protein [Frankiales bacterium]